MGRKRKKKNDETTRTHGKIRMHWMRIYMTDEDSDREKTVSAPAANNSLRSKTREGGHGRKPNQTRPTVLGQFCDENHL